MTFSFAEPNRRAALAGLAALWATPTIVSAQAAQVAKTSVLSWTPTALTPAQARALDAAAELIVPATDTPGAREAGVAASVDRWVGNYCPPAQAQAIKSGLDRMDADARALHAADFAALAPDQQTALLNRYEAEVKAPQGPQAIGRGDTETGLSNRTAAQAAPARAFFPALKELVTVAYFTSQRGGTKAVRYDPVPGAFHGCVPLSQIGRAWTL
jgi:hypothetical protein